MRFESEQIDGILSSEKAAELDQIQERAAQNSINYLDVRTDHDPFPLIAMATGIGKGRIIHKIIERKIRENPNAKVLVIVGTKLTLVDQTRTALNDYNLTSFESSLEHDYSESEDIDAPLEDTEEFEDTESIDDSDLQEQSFLYKVIDYKKKKGSSANVYAATIQTVQSEIVSEKLDPLDYDLVIADEVHNIGTSKRVDVIKKFKNVIGFTATPYRHTGVLKEPEQYGFTIIDSLTLPEAQEKDLLPPLLETQIDTSHLIEDVPTTFSGQIDYKKLEILLKASEDLRPFIATELVKHIGGDEKPKTVVAVNFVWEAEEIAKFLQERGVSVGVAVNQNAAKTIDSEEIPALDAIDRYKLPEENPRSLQVLISPYVASEGFDAPATKVIVWASPTDSSVRYTQFTGRTARRYPGKSHGLVIDFLYQTSQYSWSYNFGQWMKDSVVQLPNGMLFQGSERQLQRLTRSKNFNQIEQINRPEKAIAVSELQNDGLLLPVQEDEMGISRDLLEPYFLNVNSALQTAVRVLDKIAEADPSRIILRKNGNRLVKAVSDPDAFKRMMVEEGATLRLVEPELQENELRISEPVLTKLFIGGGRKIMPAVRNIVSEIEHTQPNLIIYRNSQGGKGVLPYMDRNLLIQKMQERGFELQRQIDQVHETDMPISGPALTKVFVGHYARLTEMAEGVLDDIREHNPEVIVERRIGKGAIITAVADKEFFIQKMLEKGAELKNPLEDAKETDIVVTQGYINRIFVNGHSAMPVAREVLEEIKSKNPELVVKKRSGARIVDSIIDGDLFIQGMLEKGARLKMSLEDVRETDFVVSSNNVTAIFIGDGKRIMPVAREILEELKEEHPELVVRRRSGVQIVDSITDRNLFIQKMIEKGEQLREQRSEN